jgi:hypothetical protein
MCHVPPQLQAPDLMKFAAQNPEKIKNLTWFAAISALTIWQVFVLNLIFVEPIAKHTALAYHDPTGGKNVGTRVADFVEFYTAGCMAASADSHKIYDADLQLQYMNKIIAPYHLDSPAYCQYTPLVFIMMIPLASFPPETALVLWSVGGLIAGFLGAIVLMRHLRWTWRQRILFLLLLLTSSVGVLTLAMGQISWWYFGLLSVYLYCLMTGKDLWAGIALTFTVVKPHYMVFYAIPPLVYGRWRLLITAFITGLLLLLVAGTMLGWENILNYPQYVMKAEVHPYGNVYPQQTACIHALFSIYLDKHLALKLSLAATLIALAIACGIWILARRTGGIDSPISYWATAVMILCSLSLSAHTNIHDTILIAVPAMLTLVGKADKEAVKSIWLKIWRLLILTYPITSWLLIMPPVASVFLRLPFFAIELALSICALCQFRRVSQNYQNQVPKDG